jgi:cell wall-associated NlpC family hydrolase
MQLSDHACRNHVRAASCGTVRALLAIGVLSVGLWVPAQAQNVQSVPNPVPAASADAEDPVSRFLVEKGLMPSTKPVVEMAQQVRSKASDMASSLVTSAMDFLGVPYKLGGTSRESGFDCSGFTRHVFENSVGLVLPRRSAEQANSPDLVPVAQSELKPGDLVFFNTLRRTFSHVGIYIGDNKFIHSPRTGASVRVEDIRVGYWQKRFDGARRAPAINGGTVQAAATAER